MKQYLSLQKIVFALAFVVLIIGFSAFGQQDKSKKDSFRKQQDSNSGASGKHDRNGDAYRLDLIDEQMKKLDVEMKKMDIELKKLDLSQIGKDVEESLKKVDWEKINEEVKESLAAVDKVVMADVRKQLEAVKAKMAVEKKQLDAVRINQDKIKVQVEEAMKDARKSMEAAKEEMKLTKEFIDMLQKDGIIDKSKTKRIEVRDGQLFIDGKKQPDELNDKYKSYYRKDNYSITLNGDNADRI
jgi:hypothetical protein